MALVDSKTKEEWGTVARQHPEKVHLWTLQDARGPDYMQPLCAYDPETKRFVELSQRMVARLVSIPMPTPKPTIADKWRQAEAQYDSGNRRAGTGTGYGTKSDADFFRHFGLFTKETQRAKHRERKVRAPRAPDDMERLAVDVSRVQLSVDG